MASVVKIFFSVCLVVVSNEHSELGMGKEKS
jgi:hypothetical protein